MRLAQLAVLALASLLSACSRAAQTTPAAAPLPPVEYVDTWGSHGDGPGQLDAPVALASDGESIIYVADSASGYINKFSPSGEPRLSFQDDRMNLQPADIAVDAGAAIYVADHRHSTVVIFFSDGMHHRQLRASALSGARESMHVAVDSYGTIYVAAKHPFGIRRFSQALRLIGSWGTGSAREAAVDNPSALAVGPDGLVYVSESERPQIKVYDVRGTPQRTLTAPTDAPDARFSGLALNAKYIFAVDSSRPAIYVWALDGTYRMTQDLSPWIPAAATPVARKLVVTPKADLLVLDPAAARVFRFRLHL